MARPKLLNVFMSKPDNILYTKTPSYVTVVRSGQNLVVQETIRTIQEGSSVTFLSPCNSDEVTGITINGVTYVITEANGNSPISAFVTNAMISVVLDPARKKAYIQNSADVSNDDTSTINVIATAVVTS